MNAAVLLIISIAILLIGYIFYGRWLSKKWGVDPNKATPAHTMEDGVDYVLPRLLSLWDTTSPPSPAQAR